MSRTGKAGHRLLYDPRKDPAASFDQCFLCGANLDDGRGTDEHVFPKWLQGNFDLRNQELTLLNGTSIAYRSLTVPSCVSCNVNDLSKVEASVKAAVSRGCSGFEQLEPRVLHTWLLKIVYGVLRRELFLLADRTNADGETIVPQPVFEQFNMCRTLLQSARFQTEYLGNMPWSIFRVRCHAYEQPIENFDFLDSVEGLCVALRMGEAGVVACLQDNNSQEQLLGPFYSRLLVHPLHPIQFKEFASRVFYQQSLFNRTPKYLTRLPDTASPMMQVVGLPPQGLSLKPIYDDWNQADYARVLSQFTGLARELIFREPDQVMTWLMKPDGTPKVMRADDGP